MKRLVAIAGIVLLAAGFASADQVEGMTKEEYLRFAERLAQKKGWNFSKEKAEAKFEMMDANKDGILTKEEQAVYQK
ncbi:MAG: hypothetical protein WC959_03875 [Kiritimatiellales bacterium]